jgi:hypothetical protein
MTTELKQQNNMNRIARTANSSFAKSGVPVVKSSSVFQFGALTTALMQSPKPLPIM